MEAAAGLRAVIRTAMCTGILDTEFDASATGPSSIAFPSKLSVISLDLLLPVTTTGASTDLIDDRLQHKIAPSELDFFHSIQTFRNEGGQ